MSSPKEKRRTSGKDFTVRYGKKVREGLAQVKKKKKEKHECPNCSKKSLKRLSTGIWQCKSCGIKVTSQAYAYQARDRQKQRLQVSEGENEEAAVEEKDVEVDGR